MIVLRGLAVAVVVLIAALVVMVQFAEIGRALDDFQHSQHVTRNA